MSDTPRTAALLTAILERDGEVSQKNAPEDWVILTRGLERDNAGLREKYATAFEGLTKILHGVEDPQQVASAYAQACVDKE